MFKAIREAENVILNLNKEQLSDGKNYLGIEVGTYKEETAMLALFDKPRKPKEAGSPYNFEWSGDFFDNFKMGINGNEVTITSNVQGDDSKLNFLLNNNLFGLNEDNLKKVIREQILPKIHIFARQTLNV
jgi:hypothetical protein